VIIDKPAGLPAQATRAGEPGVYELLCRTESYVGLHHRLDRNASGLMLLTLQRSANAAIAQGFREHSISRTYRALLEGEARSGVWSWPVDRKPAVTEVRALSTRDGRTEVECALQTGRKHQIRIHAAMAGTPIVGDTRYGGDLTAPIGRLALHAQRLDLNHPITQQPLSLRSPTWEFP